ncbi:MAG: type II toxin-antitoxin system RelE/ParE family toxin [Verrucomicrobia bacterium]|nr:type II toxin-antitoxin system RelE/ParE family toxin [Verrucomicrobiota bacterium]
MKEYIAYEGTEFTIEWFYDTAGKSQALEYFMKQPESKKRKVLNLFRLMDDHGKIFDKTKFRYEDDKIYAFKPQPDRYMCFFYQGRKIIVTNAFVKKTDKLPKEEKEQALKAYRNYENRIKENTYYEKN